MVEFVGEMRISRFLRRFKSTAEKTIDTLPDGKCRLTVYDDDEQPLSSHDFSSAAIHEAFLEGLNENEDLLESEAEFKAANAELFAKAQGLRSKNKELLAKNKELAAKNKELAKMMQTIRDLTHQFDDPTSNDSGDEQDGEADEAAEEQGEKAVKHPGAKRRNANPRVGSKPKKLKSFKPKSIKPKRAPCFHVRWSDIVLAAVRAFLAEHKDGDYAWLASAIKDVKFKEEETPSTIKGFPVEFQKAWANFKLTAGWGILTATLFPDKVLLLKEKQAKYRESQIPAKEEHEEEGEEGNEGEEEEEEEEGEEESAQGSGQEEELEMSPGAAASGSESD
jgi:hypothetical protein